MLTLEDDTRQLLLRPSRPLAAASPARRSSSDQGKGLWILADDAICRSLMEYDYELALEIRGGLFRKHFEGELRLEVKDWVDNAAGVVLRLESRR